MLLHNLHKHLWQLRSLWRSYYYCRWITLRVTTSTANGAHGPRAQVGSYWQDPFLSLVRCGGGIQSRYRSCNGCGEANHTHETCELIDLSHLQGRKSNMVECGTLMTLTNQQLEARFCNMKLCPIVTRSSQSAKASVKGVTRKPSYQLIESKWNTDMQVMW